MSSGWDSRKRAFTQIELLAVIVVVTILVALVVPGLRSARAGSYSVRCMGNLRQLYQGSLMYLAENNQQFWPDSYPGANAWFGDYATGPMSAVAHGPLHYLGWMCVPDCYQTGTVMDCPANNQGWAGNQLDYCYNGILYYYPMSRIHRAAQVVLFLDGYSYTVGWPSQKPTDLFTAWWSGRQATVGAFVHSGQTANCVFLDGHIEALNAQQLGNDSVTHYYLDPRN